MSTRDNPPHFFDAILTEETIHLLEKMKRNRFEIITTFHLKELMKTQQLIVELKDHRAGEANGMLINISEIGFTPMRENNLDIWSLSIEIANGFGWRIRWAPEKSRMYVN